MSVRIGREVAKKDREIWNASDPSLRAWIAVAESKEKAILNRVDTLANEAELDHWFELEVRDFDLAARIASSDAEFVR